MSKKKNTLQDLDDFLKQQAAALVTPQTLSNEVEPQEKARPSDSETQKETKPVFEDLESIASKQDPAFRKKLYDFIIQSLEVQKDSLPEDKMLINTALYLKSGNDWKNVIRSYWKGK
jgi:hypothetical protein